MVYCVFSVAQRPRVVSIFQCHWRNGIVDFLTKYRISELFMSGILNLWIMNHQVGIICVDLSSFSSWVRFSESQLLSCKFSVVFLSCFTWYCRTVILCIYTSVPRAEEASHFKRLLKDDVFSRHVAKYLEAFGYVTFFLRGYMSKFHWYENSYNMIKIKYTKRPFKINIQGC